MEGFIAHIATALYHEYGDDISSLHILFPSRRARLFFADTLARVAAKPLWEPTYTTIDEMMEELSGLHVGDRIRLITELYKVYSQFHQEDFDSFYFWGEMLLSDFDAVDKYMIDAQMLFSNISDLKVLESDYSYLTPEQRTIIARFWRSFGQKSEFSDEKQKFITIWQTLWPIYRQYKEQLAALGVAYTGMVHRVVAEKIEAGEVALPEKRHYVIAGFNALTKCEKQLFDYLSKNHEVDFFWDYDHYYVDNEEQEAGLFLRENMRRFPQRMSLPGENNFFRSPKEISVIAAPSDSLQCKYVQEFLTQVEERMGRKPDKETAVVLTDENLLVPLLYSIKPEVDKINITMGYPLRLTLAYAFVERLIGLQVRKRTRGKRTMFYHQDVLGLLTHPFVMERWGEMVSTLAGKIVARQQVYVEVSELTEEGLAEIFTPTDDAWQNVADYLIDVVSGTMQHGVKGESVDETETKQQVEFLITIVEHLRQLKNSLMECEIQLSVRIFASLLRRLLQTVRIPYEGEPLEGVQVMGILETRNLDFENVLLLSVNDDTFPGNRATSFSFIPYNLRLAYGLPTPMHHEGVYAYYFYRLLQRARRVHMVYCSRSDEKSSGEQSRYIYQLEYESPHTVLRKSVKVDINMADVKPIEVAKTGRVADQLNRFLQSDGPALSPTSFYHYIECPLKFYFHSVARLQKDEEVAEEVDSPMFGSILHRAMEILYTPLVGDVSPQEKIKRLIRTPQVDEAVHRAICEEYLKGEDIPEDEYGGQMLLIKDIVCKYINTCLLPFDAKEGFMIEELEKKIGCVFEFETVEGHQKLRFGGKADRIDRKSDGTIRVVDYKTGKQHIDFKGIAALFSKQNSERSAAVLQTLLYSMMIQRATGKDVQPALYYIRQLNKEKYSPFLFDNSVKREVSGYLDYKDEFETKLKEVLQELFDLKQPFTQCLDSTPCAWCDFNKICRR